MHGDIHVHVHCTTVPSKVVSSLIYSLFQRIGNSSSLKMREKSAIRITPVRAQGIMLDYTASAVCASVSAAYVYIYVYIILTLSAHVLISLTLFDERVNFPDSDNVC